MAVGPSTTTSPYLIGSVPNVSLTSILTAGDALPGGGVFAGLADGLTAFESGVGNFDVTVSLNAWLSGATSSAEANLANKGWVFIANGTDGWDFSSFEGASTPLLTVTYTMPESGSNAAVARSLAAASLESVDGGVSTGMGYRHWNPHKDLQPSRHTFDRVEAR